MQLGDGRRLGPYDPGEKRGFIGFRDVSPGGIHHGNFVAAGPEGADHLHCGGEGDIAFG
jgi:hypothetical protein